MLFFLALILYTSTTKSEQINPVFTTNYFSDKRVNQIVVFACWNATDTFKFSQYISDKNSRIAWHIIQDNMNMGRILKVNYYKLGIVLDLDCPRSEIVFEQFSGAHLTFNESYLWLAVTTAAEVPLTILRDLPLTVESELTVALSIEQHYELYDVYNHAYRHGGKINVTFMGHWKNGLLKNYLTQYKYKRRQNFYGIPLNFSIALTHKPKPHMMETYLTTPINPHIDTMTRLHYPIILKLRDMYNFTMNLMHAKTWGYKQKNGSFTGILGQMVKGIVDISVTPFQYIKNRVDVCEYTVETYVVKPYIMFRHPTKNKIRNQFLKPFSQVVWWFALNIGIACWILLLISIKLQKYCNSKSSQEISENMTSETALITIAAVAQQGTSKHLRLYSGRIVLITLFLWALLMYQFYSASIVGSLLAVPPRFINTINDLANSDMHYAYEDIAYSHVLMNSSDPFVTILREKKMKFQRKRANYTTALEGFEQVRKGGYAFFIDSATGYKIIEDTFTQAEICDLAEIALVPPKYVSIVTSKRSPFKKMVIYGLRQMVEKGLTKQLFHVWNHRRPNCPDSFRSQPVPVEIREFGPAVFIIVGGFIIACVLVAAELIRFRILPPQFCKFPLQCVEDKQGSSIPDSKLNPNHVPI